MIALILLVVFMVALSLEFSRKERAMKRRYAEQLDSARSSACHDCPRRKGR